MAEKECCHNCHWYSRMWNFCGNPKSTACKEAKRVGAYDWCIYWERRASEGMDIREKLVELIKATPIAEVDGRVANAEECIVSHVLESIADHLIANNVTVQECKVGDTIFEVDGEHGVVKHEVYEICTVYKTTATDDKGMEWDDYWTTDDIGNSFKTRGEAEASLPTPPKGE